jgi:hypothetical protein
MSLQARKAKNLPWVLLIGGIPFFICGILFSWQISEWGETWKQRKAMVDSGAVRPLEATVTKKWKDIRGSGKHSSREFLIQLEVPGEKTKISEEVKHSDVWDAIEVGESITVYSVDGDYFIPVLHTGGHHWARWMYLRLGAVPMILGASWLLGRRLWNRSPNR